MVPNTYSDHNFLSSHTVYKIDIIEMNKSISSCVDNEVYVLCTYKCMYACMYVCMHVCVCVLIQCTNTYETSDTL